MANQPETEWWHKYIELVEGETEAHDEVDVLGLIAEATRRGKAEGLEEVKTILFTSPVWKSRYTGGTNSNDGWDDCKTFMIRELNSRIQQYGKEE